MSKGNPGGPPRPEQHSPNDVHKMLGWIYFSNANGNAGERRKGDADGNEDDGAGDSSRFHTMTLRALLFQSLILHPISHLVRC